MSIEESLSVQYWGNNEQLEQNLVCILGAPILLSPTSQQKCVVLHVLAVKLQ